MSLSFRADHETAAPLFALVAVVQPLHLVVEGPLGAQLVVLPLIGDGPQLLRPLVHLALVSQHVLLQRVARRRRALCLGQRGSLVDASQLRLKRRAHESGVGIARRGGRSICRS